MAYVPGTRALIEANPHLCEIVELRDSICVIDGVAIARQFWEETVRGQALSDFAECARLMRNFFEVLVNANVKPHVCLRHATPGPEYFSGSRLSIQLLERKDALTQLQGTSQNNVLTEFSMHSHIILAEILEEFGVDTCQKGDYVNCGWWLNAVVLSNNSSLFYRALPVGFVNINRIDLRNPSNRMSVFYFDKLKAAIGADKKRYRLNEDALPMFMWMIKKKDKNQYVGDFIDKFCGSASWPHRVDLDPHARHALYRMYLNILNMLVTFTSGEALRYIAAGIPKNIDISEEDIKSNRTFIRESCGDFIREWNEKMAHAPKITEKPSKSKPPLKFYGLNVETYTSVNYTKRKGLPRDRKQNELPSWFSDIIWEEFHHGNNLFPLLHIGVYGYFALPYFQQNPNTWSSSFASLHIRKVIYGIFLNDQRDEDTENHLYVLEIVNGGDRELYECHIDPTWSLEDKSRSIDLPGLNDIPNLELDERQSLFAVALVGRNSWISDVIDRHPDSVSSADTVFVNTTYPLLVLKSWAMRSSEIHQMNIIALALSIVVAEKLLGQSSGVFPWPVVLENGVELMKIACQFRLNKGLNVELLHPFAQLQSTMTDARHLNAVLNYPYGSRVDRIKLFLSEKIYYNIMMAFQSKGRSESRRFVKGLFDKKSYANFSHIVKILLDPEDPKYWGCLSFQRSCRKSVYSTSDFRIVTEMTSIENGEQKTSTYPLVKKMSLYTKRKEVPAVKPLEKEGQSQSKNEKNPSKKAKKRAKKQVPATCT